MSSTDVLDRLAALADPHAFAPMAVHVSTDTRDLVQAQARASAMMLLTSSRALVRAAEESRNVEAPVRGIIRAMEGFSKNAETA